MTTLIRPKTAQFKPPFPFGLERVKGIEPSTEQSEASDFEPNQQKTKAGYTQIRAQISDACCPDLAKVVAAWAKLPSAFKSAILAIISACPAKGLAASAGEVPPQSNFPDVPPSASGELTTNGGTNERK